MIPRTVLLATGAALTIGGTSATSAQTGYVLQQPRTYVVEPGYVETVPAYDAYGSTVIVPAAPIIAVPSHSVTEPAYIEPRVVVPTPQPGYPTPRYSLPRSRTYGCSSIRYADPPGCILDSDGYCY